MDATYSKNYQARAIEGTSDYVTTATLPDHVAENQQEYDGQRITVLTRLGEEWPAILRGDCYGLGTPGQGDPVVELLEEEAR